MGAEAWDLQSGEPDKRCHPWAFDSPQAKPVFAEVLLDVVNHRVALDAAKATSEKFHNSGIGIHRGKCFPIIVTPLAKTDAAARQSNHGAHRAILYDSKQPSFEVRPSLKHFGIQRS
jgi:hypothetical protein